VNGGNVEVHPTDRCDRCNHQARQHHQKWESFTDPWRCTARIGVDHEAMIDRTKEIPLFCSCDGYVPGVAS
jgi:hypothetical protein